MINIIHSSFDSPKPLAPAVPTSPCLTYISNLVNWLWSKLRPLFSWVFCCHKPLEQEVKPLPPNHVVEAIRKVNAPIAFNAWIMRAGEVVIAAAAIGLGGYNRKALLTTVPKIASYIQSNFFPLLFIAIAQYLQPKNQRSFFISYETAIKFGMTSLAAAFGIEAYHKGAVLEASSKAVHYITSNPTHLPLAWTLARQLSSRVSLYLAAPVLNRAKVQRHIQYDRVLKVGAVALAALLYAANTSNALEQVGSLIQPILDGANYMWGHLLTYDLPFVEWEPPFPVPLLTMAYLPITCYVANRIALYCLPTSVLNSVAFATDSVTEFGAALLRWQIPVKMLQGKNLV